MIFEVLRHTPIWVYALFAYLVWIGIKRLQPAVRDVRRVGLVPIVFIVWGLAGLVQRIDMQPMAGLHWLIGAIAGCAAGLMLQQSLLADRVHLRVLQPASVIPLLRILAIFGSHYLLNVAAAIHPHDRAAYLDLDVYVSGISAGYFIGWGIRFILAYRNAPQTNLADGAAMSARLRDDAAHLVVGRGPA
jgi:hypothetical protein